MDRYTKAFVVASLVYFFLAAVLGVWMGAAEPAGWVQFAHVHFNLLGFMSMMIYGVGYFILPRFNGRTLRWPSWVPLHFFAANAGLIGMVATASERPSTGFALFGVLSVVSVAMFVVNLGATMLLAPAEAEEEEEEQSVRPQAPTPPPVDIHPDMRVGEILTRWPRTVEVFVANGFASLGNPEHREQVKQIPITLRMACQRHNVDLEPMVAKLSAAAGGAPQPAVAGISAGGPPRKGGLSRGEPIRGENILGDILAVYPETVKVFKKYYGEGCFSCPGQATESVKQSAMMHNVVEKQILSDLNRAAGF
jgi:hypothetical protein